jgi:hypothetical protein
MIALSSEAPQMIAFSYVLLISGMGARGLYERLMIWLGPGFWSDTWGDLCALPFDVKDWIEIFWRAMLKVGKTLPDPWPLANYDGWQGHVAIDTQEEERAVPRATHLFQILIPPHLDAPKYQGEDHPFSCCMRNLQRLGVPYQRRARHCARVKDLISSQAEEEKK